VRIVAFIVVGSCLALAPWAYGQATFRAGVDVVACYATVVGEDGALMPHLTARDFELKADGKPQDITVFQAGLLPITIVVLLDDSPSMHASKPSTTVAGTAFIRRLRPGDRATVGVFSRTVTLDGALTSDTDELIGRLGVSSPVMAGTALWDALNAAMAVLEDEPGRRVVLVLTDGDDNTSEMTSVAMAERAIREGVMVYAIGIRSTEGRLGRGLKDLARDTGGFFFELKPSDNLTSVFQRVADELHAQYLIGFSPGVLDGRAHRLQLKARRPGLTVRARMSYVALAPGLPAPK
jgi:Ca-activated chloride channel homolog